MKKYRIILYQNALGIMIPKNDLEAMKEYRPHFVCFPEYFFINRRLTSHTDATEHTFRRQLKRIELLSIALKTTVIGGTLPELSGGRIYNTSFIYNKGKLLGSYRKQKLFFPEVGIITPGNEYRVFSAQGIKFGVIICADVFNDRSFIEMKRLGAKIIFIPTFSLKKQETHEEKYLRDNEIFVRGAVLSGAVIAKVCSIRSEYRNYIQARSLIADGNGVIYRVKPEEEDMPLIIKQEVQI
jgi:predicted amidohydrolase